ncbi:histidine phosphatase family protein [Shewanella sp. 4_MG-2023]|uniref:histidine phosphatase family protein n=1 Tax=Shewanella sp. 4_MG-2023 TaxID=3062652 RepID=UPI0026E3FFF1|nr:histidine phosphatase family protein [Shewanella sp. 4_MG-2023]MDO6677646.1 histidine phosphatase family protein [Shewanella sp. 4_MG-2023]
MNEQHRMSFHYPEGVAAISDSSGAYHITTDEVQVYSHRFIKTFGFYDGVATVVDALGYLHINLSGEALNNNRFIWSGNFQDGLCVVEDPSGFYHVNKKGLEVYRSRFTYVGDFRYGLAVAYQGESAFHINQKGERVYSCTFTYAEPFHKGFAVVRDRNGFYHIDQTGHPIHNLRLKRAEPFYNNFAFCENTSNKGIRLQENGHYTYLCHNKNAITFDEIAEKVEGGSQVAFLIRHSDRHAITEDTPNWGNEITLSKLGKQRAELFGRKLAGLGRIQLFSSPLIRCLQTCENIQQETDSVTLPLQKNAMLGDPGIYFDGSFEHETDMAKDFHGFVDKYLETGFANGMLPLAQASEELNSFIEKQMSNATISVLVTHDLHAACMMHFLGLKTSNKSDWCDYLEGICYIKNKGEVTVRRLAPIKEV